MANTIEYILSLRDQVSGNLNKITSVSDDAIKRFADLKDRTKTLENNFKDFGNSITTLRSKLDLLKQEREILPLSNIKGIRQYNKEIANLEKQIDKFHGKKAGANGVGFSDLFSFSNIAKGGAMWAATQGIQLLGDVVETTGKYERYNAILMNAMGNRSKSAQAMSDINNFAKNTPFQVDELTESYIQLYNRGFNPTMEGMNKLGDLASSTGKSFRQLTEAVLDAQMGEFERLKEFGIQGRTLKNKYVFSFKNKDYETDKNADAVKDVFMKIAEQKGIANSMNAISQTTEGQISNLKDSWDQLKATIGQSTSGVIPAAIGGFTGLVNGVKEWFTIPTEEKLRGEQAEMNSLVGAITNYNPSAEQRNALLGELMQKYPEFFSGIDSEKVKNEELIGILEKVNGQYEKRIELANLSTQKSVMEEKYNAAQNEATNAMKQLSLLEAMSKATGQAKKDYFDKFMSNVSSGDALESLTNTTDLKGRMLYLANKYNTIRKAKTTESEYYKLQMTGKDSEMQKQKDLLYVNNLLDFGKRAKEKNSLATLFKNDTKMQSRFWQLYNTKNRNAETDAELQKIMDGTWTGKTGNNVLSTRNANEAIDKVSSGGSRPTQVIINVGKLNETFTVVSNNIAEAGDKVRDYFEGELLRVLESANRAIPQMQ